MFSRTTQRHHNGHDDAAELGDELTARTRRAAQRAYEDVSDAAHELRDRAEPMLDRAAAMASRGVAAIQDGSDRLRAQALRATDTTTGYVRAEPVKAMLIAVATGAALMAILSLVSRPRR